MNPHFFTAPFVYETASLFVGMKIAPSCDYSAAASEGFSQQPPFTHTSPFQGKARREAR